MIKQTLGLRLAMMFQALSVPGVERDEEGQTLAEYALILALIAAVVAVVVATLGGEISSIFNTIGDSI